jgi:hypothetical protein
MTPTPDDIRIAVDVAKWNVDQALAYLQLAQGTLGKVGFDLGHPARIYLGRATGAMLDSKRVLKQGDVQNGKTD